MIPASCPSIPVSIFMAGNYNAARSICRAYCDEVGFCVTITQTSYVYTGGEESGFIVGLINYPRFPSSKADLARHAVAIADRLRVALGQDSYSIQYPDTTIFHSWRQEQ